MLPKCWSRSPGPATVYSLSDEERRLVREGLDELDRGEAANEAEVRAVYDKYRT
jgi:hypothetical protein